jgi:hypothetical protein
MSKQPVRYQRDAHGHLILRWVHCVVCGACLWRTPYLQQIVTFPPACDDHVEVVFNEMHRNRMMWPKSWYGHCCRDDTLVLYWTVDSSLPKEGEK